MRKTVGLAAATALACVAPSCGVRDIQSRDQAAAVLISVNTVVPWSQVADALAPNFKLASGDDALAQVAPVTARIQEQVLSAFGASLGLGLPQSFSSSTSTNTTNAATGNAINSGVVTNSSSNGTGSNTSSTSTTQAGQVPTPPTGVPAGGQVPTPLAFGLNGDLSLDPISKYQNALALYQRVQEMNREAQYAAARDCFVPYMLDVKFAVMPYRHDLRYDLHARVSFFTAGGAGASPTTPEKAADAPQTTAGTAGSGARASRSAKSGQNTAPAAGTPACPDDEAKRTPQVVPLLVTDDIERAVKSRAVETAQQIALALNFMVHGVGGNLGANNVEQALKAQSGQDFNSRLTVSRLTDNTLYARIGAANQGTGQSLVGQTYDISLLLLVPKSYIIHENDKNKEAQIQIVSQIDMRDTADGQLLGDRSDRRLVEQADRAMTRTLGLVRPGDVKKWNDLCDADKLAYAQYLAGAIQSNNERRFLVILRGGAPLPSNKPFAMTDLLSDTIPDQPPDKHVEAPKEKQDRRENEAAQRDGFRKSLWAGFSTVMTDSSFKSAYIDLRKPPPLTIPKPQSAVLLDDGKTGAQLQLANVADYADRLLTATLTVVTKPATAPGGAPAKGHAAGTGPALGTGAAATPPAPGAANTTPATGAADATPSRQYTFAAQAMSYDRPSEVLTLTFPSPAKWGIKNIGDGNTLHLATVPCDSTSICPDVSGVPDKISPVAYLLTATAPADAKPNFDITAVSQQIITKDGGATIVFTIDNLKDDSVVLTTSAGISSAADDNGALPVANGSVVVTSKTKTTVKLQIINVRPGVTVTLTAEGQKGAKPNTTSTGKTALTFTTVSPS